MAVETAPGPREVVPALEAARARTLALVESLSDAELEAVHAPIMSPLVWDLGHIAAYEDLWLCVRHGGLEPLREELMGVYDAFETPRAARGEIELLGPAAAFGYLADVRERALRVLEDEGPDPVLHEMVIRHELTHNETMMQTLALARIAHRVPDLASDPGAGAGASAGTGAGRARPDRATSGLELVDVARQTFTMGADGPGFSYDNERPAHAVTVAPFRIGRVPVTNGDWLEFVRAGDGELPGGWRREGDAWQEWRYGGWRELDGSLAVLHVSHDEAQAFAASHSLRLPTEAEWELAAKTSALAGVGEVWEWTCTPFGGYPGFTAHPYREYSEVFFGDGHRVLRGGSWAASRRVATVTYRNWDLPIRRQIFAGLRLASGA